MTEEHGETTVATDAPPSARTKVRRRADRGRYDRETVRAILDEGLICHLGFVVDGTPFVIPTMYARDGDVVYVHGSPASRMLRTAAGPTDVCLTVTLLDGLVLARAVFDHSMNYRSVVVIGRTELVTDPAEKMAASRALTEHVCRGRWADARHPNDKELNATTILRLSLAEASAKVRAGGPKDEDADMDLPVWAGVVPLRSSALAPVPDDQLAGGVSTPAYAAAYSRPGWTD